jgi:hypothetical protein
MIELLAIPEWNAPPRTLDDWLKALPVRSSIVRESDGTDWLETSSLRLRGYIILEEGRLAAINFELHDPDPDPSRSIVENAARSLGWEVHEEDDSEDG